MNTYKTPNGYYYKTYNNTKTRISLNEYKNINSKKNKKKYNNNLIGGTLSSLYENMGLYNAARAMKPTGFTGIIPIAGVNINGGGGGGNNNGGGGGGGNNNGGGGRRNINPSDINRILPILAGLETRDNKLNNSITINNNQIFAQLSQQLTNNIELNAIIGEDSREGIAILITIDGRRYILKISENLRDSDKFVTEFIGQTLAKAVCNNNPDVFKIPTPYQIGVIRNNQDLYYNILNFIANEFENINELRVGNFGALMRMGLMSAIGNRFPQEQYNKLLRHAEHEPNNNAIIRPIYDIYPYQEMSRGANSMSYFLMEYIDSRPLKRYMINQIPNNATYVNRTRNLNNQKNNIIRGFNIDRRIRNHVMEIVELLHTGLNYNGQNYNIVHLDCHWSNILIENGTNLYCIIDFGLISLFRSPDIEMIKQISKDEFIA